MNQLTIFLPVLAHITLVMILYIILGIRKSKDVKNKAVDQDEIALNNHAWSEDVIKVSNNIANQFESPVLFHILCIIIFLTNTTSLFTLSLASAFVALRYVHTFIHIGTNYVPHRFLAFLLSVVVLFVLLINTGLTVFAGL